MNVCIYVGVNTFDLKLILHRNYNLTSHIRAGGVCRGVAFFYILTQIPEVSMLEK